MRSLGVTAGAQSQRRCTLTERSIVVVNIATLLLLLLLSQLLLRRKKA